MSNLLSKKLGGLALFSSPKHIRSHYIRLISHIKELEIEYEELDEENLPKEFYEDINRIGKLPTVTDRDLVLFDERVVSEYLDERFPHPALMPIEANLRAKIRLFFWELDKNVYEPIDLLERSRLTPAKRKKIQKELQSTILQLVPLFKNGHYLIGGEMSLLDCFVLPALWRLGELEIELPKVAAPMIKYMNFHFEKDYFKRSLSKYEEGFKPYVVV